jgi:hypothetical protein
VLTVPHRQEGLSRAYIQAVAAQCGLSYSVPSPDYGIDLSLHDIAEVGSSRIESGYRIDIQARSTTLARIGRKHVRYDVDVPTYEMLRYADAGCPRILVVLVLPASERLWLTQSQKQLALRRCAYWVSLRGSPRTKNRRSVRVRLPRVNVFGVDALRSLMNRVRAGEQP